MKFSKTITVKVNAEPTSEEWFVELYDEAKETNENLGWIRTPSCTTYEECFALVPNEYKDLVRKTFAQPLAKKYKKTPEQFWSLREINKYGKIQQITICHYYHFDFDYTTHVSF